MESRQNVPAGMEIKIKMKIVETIAEVRAQVKEWRAQGLSVGLVPTMGYLHEGHKSLIDRAVAENDKVVVSVFVNPMQFGVGEDLESYPRDMERDSALCENAGAALIFHPQPEEMYHKDFSSFVDMNTLTKGLCGKTRPIHFRGVCTVVSKLFNIVQPDKAYFGQKDAQQLAVIRHMVSDLNFGIEINCGLPDCQRSRRTGKKFQKHLFKRAGKKSGSCFKPVFTGSTRPLRKRRAQCGSTVCGNP